MSLETGGSITAGSVETAADIGLDPKDVVRRWLLEIQLAGKGEDQWRRKAQEVYDRYRGGDRRKNNFNILWANTETLRPAIYNSTPKPDVRRRFRDPDPIGKAVSETLTRALDFNAQTYDLDCCLKADVLDALLPGRGVSRIRYIPSLRQVSPTGADQDEPDAEPHEPLEGEQSEELEWEQTCFEHVNWADFRRGPGRTWEEIPWVAFRHTMTRRQMVEKFGEEIGNKITLQDASEEAVNKLGERDPVRRLFQTGEVWEVWDKDSKKVLFVTSGYSESPCMETDDPLKLQGFFPCPRPIQFIEDTDKLEPIPPYALYESLAIELDNAVFRRGKIIDAIKVRGVYDSTISELSQIMRGNDNDLIPAKNVSAFIDRGGIEKMIWMMPIDAAAAVLTQLDTTIQNCIQGIYEICGIGDILRASTDPQETATAQALKSQWGTMRLQRMQREVQRYARDMVRMMAEVIGNKFQMETLRSMTGLPYPTQAEWEQEVAQQQAQYQAAAAQAAQSGQQPPQQPQAQRPIVWEQIIEVLRNSGMRAYKVDIETDSTIAETLTSDMAGLTEVIAGITQFLTGIAPMVQAGAIPIETVKEVVGTITRRARLGNAVEDAFDKIQQPQPQPDPNQAKAQAEMQVEQVKIASAEKMHQMDLQQKAQENQLEQQARAQADAASAAAEQAAQVQKARIEHQGKVQLAQHQAVTEYQRAVDVARINADSAERIAAAKIQADLEKARLDHEHRMAALAKPREEANADVHQ